ncbi:hypothetical protein, partial [Streptosporangium roseum]|uniref:hypothetical protein n=1 Tax=Streptosporangium roseum TaxID=2001 RepID=UPI0033304FF0
GRPRATPPTLAALLTFPRTAPHRLTANDPAPGPGITLNPSPGIGYSSTTPLDMAVCGRRGRR